MLSIPILIVLGAAAICFGLSRRMATRLLGGVAAGAGLIAGAVLVVLARIQPLPVVAPLFRWEVSEERGLDLLLRLDLPSLGLGLLVLVGGALALLLVALALAPGLRGFGALFGSALLVQAAALLALLCSSPLLWPFAWSILALASFATAWSSGTLRDGVDSSLSLLYSLPASLLLLVGLLLSGDASNGTISGIGASLCLVLATALAVGLPPFRGALDNLLAGPAVLGGFLTGLGLPLVALATLWRLLETSPDLQTSLLWRYGLAAYGVLSLAVSAAGALRERNLKAILGWMLTAQAGIVLVGLALARIDDQTSAVTLLLSNLALTTLAGAAVIAVLESHGRGDNYTQTDNTSQLLPPTTARLLALAWGLASASALGVPSLWGFWGYRTLFENALLSMPWVVPPLLFGLTLLAVALLFPLGGFLSAALPNPAQAETPQHSGWLPRLALVPAAYLLLVGVLPMLGWPLAATPSSLAQWLVWGALVLGLGGLLLVWRLSPPTPPADAEVPPAILAADALGESLTLLSWLGRPALIIERLWQVLLGLGEVVQFVIGLFERRYYLAGVLLALLSILLIMAQ